MFFENWNLRNVIYKDFFAKRFGYKAEIH